MEFEVESLVIGAGAIGLAIARELSNNNIETLVVEKEGAFGEHTSSRNSEVIHAGIYYDKTSLKTKFCIEGKELLYDYCKEKNVSFSNCGKYIVATSAEEDNALNNIKKMGIENGVSLEDVDSLELSVLYPQLSFTRALFSPSTGIVDSHGFMLSLVGDIESKGSMISFKSDVVGINYKDDYFTVKIRNLDENEPIFIKTKLLINSAGLWAWEIARLLDIKNPSIDVPRKYLAKGTYYTPKKALACNHLIYPIPPKGGLGTHLTIDLAGAVKFGPDVEWISEIDYGLTSNRIKEALDSISRYWPSIKEVGIEENYCGIRPKVVGPNCEFGDFNIRCELIGDNAKLINLFGIESPGLTSSLAIAKYVTSIAI